MSVDLVFGVGGIGALLGKLSALSVKRRAHVASAMSKKRGNTQHVKPCMAWSDFDRARMRPVPDERRRQLRRDGFKTGSIFVGNNPNEVDCLVWNLNELGALLEVETGSGLPSHFRLVAASLFIDRQCTTIWRDGRKIGVAFEA
ncbi:hypothetical protein MKK88_20610 [Methylobacterium sp. E-005]|uniref:hypothetical protein n=1 Tax=Methylobacterium sp. E-005 TaxID=2836549 RepID=UPI001FB8F524|nr:hypothetical protein [Methylobacterium sp. E-005]MCJ2088369.1 hypothetical protein [Methylobacterium sp. E-005]